MHVTPGATPIISTAGSCATCPPAAAALAAACTIAAWANGFITMELAGAFRLGGDVEQARRFGLDHVLAAIRHAGSA